jgi:DNA-binding transcriptional regulator YdaS (Cro superfamily)
MSKSLLKKAVKLFDNKPAAFARAIEASRQQVYQMMKTGHVPPSRCKAIERATNGEVTAEQLRPDIFKAA